MRAKIKNEINRLKKNKSIFLMPLIVLILGALNIFNIYQMSLNDQDYVKYIKLSQVVYTTFTEIFQTIYILPLFFVVYVWLKEDLKGNIIQKFTTINKLKSYVSVKLITLGLYYFVVLLFFALFYQLMSIILLGIETNQLIKIISFNNIIAFLIYWLGLYFFGIVAWIIGITFQSYALGIIVPSFYILIERIYTTSSSLIYLSPIIYKINEFLPWANWNSLFLYAHHMGSGITASDIGYAPTMIKIQSVNEIMIPLPFVKPLNELALVAFIHYVVLFIIIFIGVKYREDRL